MRNMQKLILIMILLLSLTGCMSDSEAEDISHEIKNGSDQITLTPLDLFEGENAKFEPFLGAMSGSFKLRYEGITPNAKLEVELWEHGKKVSSLGSVNDIFSSSNHEADQANQEVEVILSLDNTSINETTNLSQIKVGISKENGTSLTTFSTQQDKSITARIVTEYDEPQTFNRQEPIYLWGIKGTRSNSIFSSNPSPESLSELEQAIIFTLYVED